MLETLPISIELLAGILGGLIVGMVVLLLLQVRNSTMVNKIAAPAYEYVQHQAEAEAAEIIDRAKAEAMGIVEAARAEQATVLTTYRQHAQELQQAYEAQLNQHTTMITEKMNGSLAKHFGQLEAVAQETLETAEQRRGALEARFTRVLEGYSALEHKLETETEAFTKNLASAVEATAKAAASALEKQEHEVVTALNAQAQAAQVAVDTAVKQYQKERYTLVDAHLERMVEAVIKEVLGTQLSVEAHAEIIRDSLAAAAKAGDLR